MVHKTDAGQALVRHPRPQADGMEIAEIYAPIRKRFMEFHHQRFILGTDRAQYDLGTVLHCAWPDVLQRRALHRWLRRLVHICRWACWIKPADLYSRFECLRGCEGTRDQAYRIGLTQQLEC